MRFPHIRAAPRAADELAREAGIGLRHLSRTIGTVITGVDLRSLTDRQVEAIRAVWLDRRVLLVRGQHLDATELVGFARLLGEPTEAHPIVPGRQDEPSVFETDTELSDRLAEQYGDPSVAREKGLDWHSDVTFVRRPPAATLLNAVVVPDRGGDTLWSDQVDALASLSAPLRNLVRTLTAEHDGSRQFQAHLAAVGQGRWDGASYLAIDPVRHPVVRLHPETGEEALFVNPGFTTRILEVTRRESDALLALLFAHAVEHQRTVRWQWTAGDLAIWDNRTTQHALIGDFEGRRVTQRVTLRGDEPRRSG